jgi:FtsZ-binding cell division protein ZapB
VDHTVLTTLITAVCGLAGVVAGALGKPFFSWIGSRSRSEADLIMDARESLRKETEVFRAEMRTEIDELKREVQQLRDENLTLRRERIEVEQRHREELARVETSWQVRYGELAARYDDVLRKLEAQVPS